jgi:hypothetical protein
MRIICACTNQRICEHKLPSPYSNTLNPTSCDKTDASFHMLLSTFFLIKDAYDEKININTTLKTLAAREFVPHLYFIERVIKWKTRSPLKRRVQKDLTDSTLLFDILPIA